MKTMFLSLDEIVMCPKKEQKLLRRDRHQIEEIRSAMERGDDVLPITCHQVDGGKWIVRDGRHRFLAAKLAGVSFIQAKVLY